MFYPSFDRFIFLAQWFNFCCCYIVGVCVYMCFISMGLLCLCVICLLRDLFSNDIFGTMRTFENLITILHFFFAFCKHVGPSSNFVSTFSLIFMENFARSILELMLYNRKKVWYTNFVRFRLESMSFKIEQEFEKRTKKICLHFAKLNFNLRHFL